MHVAATALCRAIERCYAAFAHVERPRLLDASPTRDATEILRVLSSAPLRALEPDQLGPYAGWAITTVGNAEAYRHFLPRILELATADAGWLGMRPPVVADRLARAGWHDWAQGEQAAIRDLFAAAFDAAIYRHPGAEVAASDWLCGRVALGEDPRIGFTTWLAAASPMAALQLAAFVLDEGRKARRNGEIRGGFWADIDASVRQEVGRLLFSDDVADALEAATHVVTGSDRSRYLDAALSVLRRDW